MKLQKSLQDVTYLKVFERASTVLLLPLHHMVPCSHRLPLACSLDSMPDLVTSCLIFLNESQDKETWLNFSLLSRRIQSSMFFPFQKMVSWSTRGNFSFHNLGRHFTRKEVFHSYESMMSRFLIRISSHNCYTGARNLGFRYHWQGPFHFASATARGGYPFLTGPKEVRGFSRYFSTWRRGCICDRQKD